MLISNNNYVLTPLISKYIMRLQMVLSTLFILPNRKTRNDSVQKVKINNRIALNRDRVGTKNLLKLISVPVRLLET